MNPKASEKAVRLSFIFEYPPRDDWMAVSLIDCLRNSLPGLRVKSLYGIFATYRPGGLKIRRLFNMAWLYLCTAWHLTFRPPDVVLVRSSPPGIQVWTSWWARLRGVPVICWLMDYHPEMEARAFDRRGWCRLAYLLRRIDAEAMKRFVLVVTLDRAMVRLVTQRAAGIKVIQHPTWANPTPRSVSLGHRPGHGSSLRLAYSGNLGAAHDLEVIGRLLAEISTCRKLELYVIGASVEGDRRFDELGRRANISVICTARVPFANLIQLYNEWQIDAGIVLLSENSLGLVSPSKFSGYIDFGLPIIYVGPPDTNPAEICSSFGAGFWLTNDATETQIKMTAKTILDPEHIDNATSNSAIASKYFTAFNQDSLTAILLPCLQERGAR